MTTIFFRKLKSALNPPGTAPSVRVPVIPSNREYLRRIRQQELEAWRSAPGGTLHRPGGGKSAI